MGGDEHLLSECRRLCAELEIVIKSLVRVPSVKYSYLCRQLSLLYFYLGKKREAIYYLVNCLGFQLRYRAICRDTIMQRERMLNSATDIRLQKRYLEYQGEYDTDGFSSMMKRLHDLPSQWRVVQISVPFNAKKRLENGLFKIFATSICITSFECGAAASNPLVVTIPQPSDSNVFWEEFIEILKINRQRYDELHPIIHNRRKEEANHRMSLILNEMRERWLGVWMSIVVGSLVDCDYSKKLRSSIDDIVNECNLGHMFLDRGQDLLYLFVEGYSVISEDEFEIGVRSVLNEKCSKSSVKELIFRLKDLCSSSDLSCLQRNPVILVVDEELELFPWEMLKGLVDQPVSRVSSIPLLHALYHEHKDRIKNGCVEYIFKPENGFYLLNPEQNLSAMEERMAPFLQSCLEGWEYLVSERPTEEHLKSVLTTKDIFIYFGHGSGGKYLHPHKIAKLNVHATVLLFGCKSNTWAYEPFSDKLSTSKAYSISSSPCVLGMLWEVPDRDTDAMSMELLKTWLMPSPDREPELLRAVIRGRSGAREFVTKSSMVVRGLPTRTLL